MVCQACGSPVVEEVRFCSKCGAQVAGPVAAPPGYPPMYAGQLPAAYSPLPRVQRNLQTLGSLWCIYAGYRLLAGLLGVFFLRAFSMHGFGGRGGWMLGTQMPPIMPLWMGAMVPVVATATVIGAVLAAFVGFSLLQRKPWGRTLAIVVSILALFRFPLGTALGIYTLWVLAPSYSGMEYEALADRS
jgi:hypothetical protein